MCHTCHSYTKSAEIEICNIHVSDAILTIFHQMFLSPFVNIVKMYADDQTSLLVWLHSCHCSYREKNEWSDDCSSLDHLQRRLLVRKTQHLHHPPQHIFITHHSIITLSGFSMFKNRLDSCYHRHSRRAVLCTWYWWLLMLLESCSMSLSEKWAFSLILTVIEALKGRDGYILG